MRIPSLSLSIAAFCGLLAINSHAQNVELPGGVDIQFGGNRQEGRSEDWVLSKMHQVNDQEIRTAHLAMDRARSPRVRDYAKHLLDDHQRSDDRVTELARRKGIALREMRPMDDEQRRIADDERRTMDELRDARDERFDRLFVRAMIEGHDHVIQALEASMDRLHDEDVRRLADRTLSDLREHRRMAQDLQDHLEHRDPDHHDEHRDQER